MTNIVEVSQFGSVDVLKLKEIHLKPPATGQVLVKHTAIGLSYNDVLARKGHFDINLPFVPGHEACGVIEEITGEIKGFSVGERVAYVTAPDGAYSEERIIAPQHLVTVPDYVDDDDVAACLSKGMVAHYLMRRTFFVRKGNTIMIHAAAGATGMIMCMMAKQFEATIIATVGSDDKKSAVNSLGVDLVLNYNDVDFVTQVMDFTKGEGVDVVYDLIGKTTFKNSQQVLGNFGLLVCAGFSSGVPDQINAGKMFKKSSFITCPNFMQYKSERMELVLSANEVFAQIQKKLIKPHFYKKYKLNEVKQAHVNLEERKQIGQSIIVV